MVETDCDLSAWEIWNGVGGRHLGSERFGQRVAVQRSHMHAFMLYCVTHTFLYICERMCKQMPASVTSRSDRLPFARIALHVATQQSPVPACGCTRVASACVSVSFDGCGNEGNNAQATRWDLHPATHIEDRCVVASLRTPRAERSPLDSPRGQR